LIQKPIVKSTINASVDAAFDIKRKSVTNVNSPKKRALPIE